MFPRHMINIVVGGRWRLGINFYWKLQGPRPELGEKARSAESSDRHLVWEGAAELFPITEIREILWLKITPVVQY